MIGQLRKKVSDLFTIPAKPFAVLGIHPNIVSLLAIPFSLASAFFIFSGEFPFALLFAVLAVSMDLIDGAVARLTNKSSLFGNYFETMIDKYVEFILFGGCALLYPLPAFLAFGFSLIESYAKPRAALVIITDNRDWPAIGEHGDRLLILLAGIALSFFQLSFFGFSVLETALYLIAVLTLIGGVQRMFFAKKLIEDATKNGNILPYLKKSASGREQK